MVPALCAWRTSHKTPTKLPLSHKDKSSYWRVIISTDRARERHSFLFVIRFNLLKNSYRKKCSFKKQQQLNSHPCTEDHSGINPLWEQKDKMNGDPWMCSQIHLLPAQQELQGKNFIKGLTTKKQIKTATKWIKFSFLNVIIFSFSFLSTPDNVTLIPYQDFLLAFRKKVCQ